MMKAAADGGRRADEADGGDAADQPRRRRPRGLGFARPTETSPAMRWPWPVSPGQAGLAGVVCSPHDVAAIRQACGREFLTVVPGLRPKGASPGDQKRFATPGEARKAGGDVLVIGRPITAAADPAAAAEAVLKEIEDAG